jgi:hypothetical protein
MKINNIEISTKVIVFFCISLLGFYFLNVYTNIVIDDFVYKHIFTSNPSQEGIRVKSISDIVESQYNHYFIQNGRLVVNGLAQLFLIPENKLWFNIVNTLLFGILQILIIKRSNIDNNKVNTYLYSLLVLFIWFLVPAPNHTLLWLDGSINYLWATILVLLFLHFFDKINSNSVEIKYIYIPLLLLFGFIAGFTHEVLTVGVSGALCIEGLKNLKKYKLATFVLVFAFFVGTFLMVVAPGNILRLTAGGESQPLAIQIAKRVSGFIISYQSLSAFWILLVTMLFLFFKDKMAFKAIYKKQELLFHSIFISLIFIFFAGAFEARVFFGVAIFSICILLTIIKKYQNVFITSKAKWVYLLLILGMLFEFSTVIVALKANKTEFDKDEITWRETKDNVFELREKKLNRFVCTGYGGNDRYFWSNVAMSWYYNKNFMIFIPTDLYHNLYKTNTLISSKNEVKLLGLKNPTDSLKIYSTTKKDFFIYKLPANISKNISDGAFINYKSNTAIAINRSGLKNNIKDKLSSNKNLNANTEKQPCFVLPTEFGNFLVFKSPLNIPFKSINTIEIFRNDNDKTPVLEF